MFLMRVLSKVSTCPTRGHLGQRGHSQLCNIFIQIITYGTLANA